MVLAAFLVPQGAPLLGMHLAAQLWNALRLTAPFLSQVGDVTAGAIGGRAHSPNVPVVISPAGT